MILCSEIVEENRKNLLDINNALNSVLNINIQNITNDSRHVTENTILFIINRNALEYSIGAMARQPVLIILDLDLKNTAESCFNSYKIVFSQFINIRKLYSRFVVQFYGLEKYPLKIVAVTGTNGKSSTVYFYKQLCNLFDIKSCCIGTTGIYSDDIGHQDSKMTTPDISDLCKIICHRVSNGIVDIAIEASSHGIDQYRLYGIPITTVGFTNFTRDHLDYHKDINEYWEAKKKLFTRIVSADSGHAVINSDDEKATELKTLCLQRNLKITTFGINVPSDIQIISYEILNSCYHMRIRLFGIECSLVLKRILGKFQMYNLMLAVGLFVAVHPDKLASIISPNCALKILESIQSPPGRMEIIPIKEERIAIIDYAHNPDGLESLLKSINEFKQDKRVLLVFGCGGNRDSQKRCLMGMIANKYADFCILTDDNPRHENPDDIRNQIKTGMQNHEKYFEISDRRKAIKMAIFMSADYKIVVVAGKGHEKTQSIKGIDYEFNEKEILNEYILLAQ
jgi:UDP-N-acetylmuramoyl-L-alanyl-D-glutamate--2,6-diaminopimelate ligase